MPLEGSGKTAPAFIHDVRSTDVPADVMHVARRCLVDTLAIWASGIATEPSRIAREHAVRRYGGGDVKMPFDGRAVNPVGYAFAGAATIDAIDGHDGHQPSKGHAGVAIHPSLLAELGQAPDCTMDDLLADLIVGYEVAIRAALSLHATVPDYHSSGAWNALGCVAIAARLRGFTTEQTRHSLGIAEYYGPRAQMMRCIDGYFSR
ncbi:MAG: MmgE/PrpD family protein [Sulfitobacter sp.]